VSKTAGVVPHLQPDVSLNSPLGGPRVTDDPVGGGSSAVVTNELHAVVQHVDERALQMGQHTRLVILPCGSINADGEGTPGDQVSLEGGLAEERGGSLVGRDGGDDVSLLEGALAVLTGVGVGLVGLLASSLDQVVEGRRSCTTIATVRSGVAVNDLLGSEVDGGGGGLAGDDVGALHGFGG